MEKNEYTRMYNLESNFWWYRVLHELVELKIINHRTEGPYSIMDAGCGTGRMMEILQKYGSVSGVDFSDDAVFFARKRGLANVEKGDLNDYRFEKESFNCVVSLDVIYHKAINDDLAVVEKFYGALKKDGILILNLPAFNYLKRHHDVVVQTKKRYTKKPLVNDLKKIGFSIVSAQYRMPHLYFIILLTKLLGNGSSSKNSESDLHEIPAWLNKLLLFAGRIENLWLNKGFGIPLGSSLFIVAKKN